MRWLPARSIAVAGAAILASCGSGASREVQQPQTVETARARATRAPCDFLQAVAGALRPSSGAGGGGGGATSGWSISLEAGCCRDPSKLELRSALAGFQFVPQPDLIGWNVRCPVGVGGPAVTKNAEVRFHYLQLYEKDARTLIFALVPGSITFAAGGHKVSDVIQGCPDVSGQAALKE